MRYLGKCPGCGVKPPAVMVPIRCVNCGEERQALIRTELLYEVTPQIEKKLAEIEKKNKKKVKPIGKKGGK